jgi:hypothetical protein
MTSLEAGVTALLGSQTSKETPVTRPWHPLPASQLIVLARLVDDLGYALKRVSADYVRQAKEQGATWAEIGDAFGVTRASVHQRFGNRSQSVDADR